MHKMRKTQKVHWLAHSLVRARMLILGIAQHTALVGVIFCISLGVCLFFSFLWVCCLEGVVVVVVLCRHVESLSSLVLVWLLLLVLVIIWPLVTLLPSFSFILCQSCWNIITTAQCWRVIVRSVVRACV